MPSTNLRLPTLAAALLATVTLVACGSDSSSTTSSSSTSGASSTPSTGAATQSSGAGTQSSGGAAPDGAKIFASAGCASCHALKAADSNGQVGPNLDDLKPDAATVENQVTNGGGGMPAFKDSLSPAEIKAVAAYVADNAGK